MKNLVEKYLTKNNKEINESSGAGTSYETMWNSWWSRGLYVFVREDKVLFSHIFDYPTGSILTDDDKKKIRARGYIILDW